MKKNYTYRFALLILFFVNSTALSAQTNINTDVLVIGGGAGGTAAGIQSARMGVNTIITEPTVWLGGMITAAGVAAFDGNHNMPSGIWAEFREQLYKVYGGPDKVATGWVSNTLFEPHVGDSIFKRFTASLNKLKVLYHYRFQKTIIAGNRVKGAVFIDEKTNATVIINAKQVIDATELGDAMASAKIPFDVGMEASSKTGENINIPESNNIIQDLTYVAILKDYGPAVDCTIVKPTGYNSMEFDGCCNEFSSTPDKLTTNVTAKKMLEYGKLPNGKYMINWPGKGNDTYLDVIAFDDSEREIALKKAKAKTIRFLYFLQTQFGFKNLALANDEFPTADRLALIPYFRESRRLKGLVRFQIQNIADPYNQPQALYRTGIAVGDYPIDHHHRENTNAPQHLGFYPVPSYNLPLGVLIPQKHEGIIVAEKSTSVSNVVNGTTRLQPIVILTGQAAGVLAALSVKQNKQPRQVPVRLVQEKLLEAGAYIMPYFDVKPANPHFTAIQKIGATGILKGKGEPYKWANRTWFYPDSTIRSKDFAKDFEAFTGLPFSSKNEVITLEDMLNNIVSYPGKNKLSVQTIANNWAQSGLNNFDKHRPVKRFEIAVLLNKYLNPFDNQPIDHQGNLIRIRKTKK